MKQLIVKKTIYFIVLNLIFSGLITFAVSYFTVDRHGKVLILGLNNQTKEFDYLESGPSTSYEDPKVFFRRIDMELRSEKSIFETSNRCLNLGKLKGTLPISINHYEKTFEIQIISEDEKAVLDCTIYIIELTELYNKKIQNRFKENFLFQYQENIFYDPEVTEDLRKSLVENNKKLIESFLEGKLSKELDLLNTKQILNDLTINSYIYQMTSDQSIIKKDKYFGIVESFKLIKLINEKSFLLKPPSNLKIFIACFIIFLFIFLLVNLFSFKKNINHIKNLFNN